MPSLLIASDCKSHVHLIVGHNPLASARASRSLELGASVIVLAPKDAALHYGLQQKIAEGLVRCVRLQETDTVSVEHLTKLGRAEVDGVVDAVFVTLQVGCAQSMFYFLFCFYFVCRFLYIYIQYYYYYYCCCCCYCYYLCRVKSVCY